jgi:alpha-tubulin suppressor-like RCC1 family protein
MPIACGSFQTFLVSSTGQLFACGMNSAGQLGLGDTKIRNTLTRVPFPLAVISVAGGLTHSLFVVNDGSVWSFGCNTQGQLGLGENIFEVSLVPMQIPDLCNATKIAAGYDFSLVLDTNGSVYCFGCNKFGYLGLSDISSRLEPVKNPYLKDIQHISAGTYHALALDTNGAVWTFGKADYGRLGYPITDDIQSTPRRIPELPNKIQQISCGNVHNLLLDVHGNVWSFGLNSYGQLGTGDNVHRYRPTKLTKSSKVTCVVAAGHSSFIEAGEWWAFGDNFYGQLGFHSGANADIAVSHPQRTSWPAGMTVAGGSESIFLIDQAGKIYSCGRNKFGELGHGDFLPRRKLCELQGFTGLPRSSL